MGKTKKIDVEGSDAGWTTLEYVLCPEGGNDAVLLDPDLQFRVHGVPLPVRRQHLIVIENDLDRPAGDLSKADGRKVDVEGVVFARKTAAHKGVDDPHFKRGISMARQRCRQVM